MKRISIKRSRLHSGEPAIKIVNGAGSVEWYDMFTIPGKSVIRAKEGKAWIDFDDEQITTERKLVLPANLEKRDWSHEISAGHPIVMKATKTELIDCNTGETIAHTIGGYEFFWLHRHPHVCKEGWNGNPGYY